MSYNTIECSPINPHKQLWCELVVLRTFPLAVVWVEPKVVYMADMCSTIELVFCFGFETVSL